jgi:hypothetical protein
LSLTLEQEQQKYLREEYFDELLEITGLLQPQHIVSIVKDSNMNWIFKDKWFELWLSAIPFFCRIWFKVDGFKLFKLAYKETKGKVYCRPDLTRNW